MTPEQDLPRILAFSAPGSHKPDEPDPRSFFPPECPREPERYEGLTVGCFLGLLVAAAVGAWLLFG